MAQEVSESIGGFDPEIARRLQAAGHEIIPARRTYRHAGFKQDFHPDTIVGVRGPDGTKTPLLNSFGGQITVGEILPERADLALDETGCIVPQSLFEERWVAFLDNTMLYGDPKMEPIPDVEKWVRMIPDKFSEGPGYIEVGFDAQKPAEMEATHVYDPGKNEIIDKLNEQGETQVVVAEAIKTLLEERKKPGRPRKYPEEKKRDDS